MSDVENISVAVLRSPWLNRLARALNWSLCSAAGSIAVIELPETEAAAECIPSETSSVDVLVVPGGNDQRLMASFSDPEIARDRIRTFVASGGSYYGICAGMSIATRGYWDIEDWLPLDAAQREREYFMHFTGIFPHQLENLHQMRRVGLEWNSSLPASHPMRQGVENDQLDGGRYNDGNALWVEGQSHSYAEGTEFLLS